MPTEIEATFPEVAHASIRERLDALDAVLVFERTLMRRRIYDYPDLRLDRKAAWVRVREEPDAVTLGYKQRESETIAGMVEHEVRVDSFEAACSVLEAIGLTEKAYQESFREQWKVGNCDVMLDEWPWIPQFVELEAPSEQEVQTLAARLDLPWSAAVFDSIDALYQRDFDVTRTEISSVRLEFATRPAVLTERTKEIPQK